MACLKCTKEGCPIRPVLSAIKTPGYNVSKFVASLIASYASNEYTLLNSMELVDSIKGFNFKEGMVMTSFDIESLYTNVPVKETIELLVNHIYDTEGTSVRNMEKKTFRDLLNIATSNSFFVFNNKYYNQTEGLAMGQPLSAPLANIFLCLKEKQWIQECPPEFRPVFYRRYVDDTFLIFNKQEHVNKFHEYINQQHQSIKFTNELEENRKLPFLDILLEHSNNKITTSIYRKKSHTGAGINYISHIYNNYKLSAFTTFLYRAWRLSHDYVSLHTEFNSIRTYFLSNGYPDRIIFKKIRNFLTNVLDPKPVTLTVPKNIIYIKLPFLNDVISKYVSKQLKDIINIYFPQVDVRCSFINNFKLRNFTNHKDKIPSLWLSDVVYKYECAVCGNCYFGSTNRSLAIRISEHQGRSYRTKQILAKPLQSSIRHHSEGICDKQISFDEFKVIYKGRTTNEIRIAESLLIKSLKPELNLDESSVPLKLF